MQGIAIASSIYEGRVRVLYSPVNAPLNRGEIIISHNTNPAWAPLFLHAGALIMESGGPLAHGAIVAREYSIPAVAGIVMPQRSSRPVIPSLSMARTGLSK